MLTELERHQRLAENVAAVRERIADAARRSGREPSAVRLVAVTKYVDTEMIRALLTVGVPDIGENRVQQLAGRVRQVGSAEQGLRQPDEPVGVLNTPRWHMVGHLQRNKVRLLLPKVRIVHSLDSDRLAEELEHRAERLGCSVDVFIEVNAGEQSKYGVAPDAVRRLAEYTMQCFRLRLCGLMVMAPFEQEPERARPHFARLRELLLSLRQQGIVKETCSELSMGMSNDYAVAVEEGATIVRIGTALYEGILDPAQR
jgi:pyridoxal phosphate enzyme (YggS family)